jgi:hypothetical protein
MVLGAGARSSERYSLAYRSIDHSRLRGLCQQCTGRNAQKLPCAPPGGFGTIADFARLALNLYELPILADYDPSSNFSSAGARQAISSARQAITWFRGASQEQKDSFLTLLLFKPR